ncbi:hypothetical protein P4O66_001281 [Electrophorus voltai]|uniref:Uncharacterized protein n=1 Tax=Electrophorus voltai TaxID=2609070 RepID=A0AAD8Z8U2_9TELE|nr:hypothetical protein P4O66_001281 [Electrophorus voltai]
MARRPSQRPNASPERGQKGKLTAGTQINLKTETDGREFEQLGKKKQRTKQLSALFHSYNPYDHKSIPQPCKSCCRFPSEHGRALQERPGDRLAPLPEAERNGP